MDSKMIRPEYGYSIALHSLLTRRSQHLLEIFLVPDIGAIKLFEFLDIGP